MKNFGKQLSEDKNLKKEFQDALHNAAVKVAEKHGFSQADLEKEYANTPSKLDSITATITWTLACC